MAELRKRGDEFWDEFEFYLSDLLVGLVLDVVLVTLLAPVAVAGRERKVAKSGERARGDGRAGARVEGMHLCCPASTADGDVAPRVNLHRCGQEAFAFSHATLRPA